MKLTPPSGFELYWFQWMDDASCGNTDWIEARSQTEANERALAIGITSIKATGHTHIFSYDGWREEECEYRGYGQANSGYVRYHADSGKVYYAR